ncbi:MAG: hypothetical protein QOE82_1372 [Thermoanaerobaculia bacterium]|jgi:hypothetical protein|nr:hypothetical protein [Thermoanaerobaculia bacterium]
MTLPNFLIIGAAKAGTTSLYHYMNEHPEAFMSPIKETNYFCWQEMPKRKIRVRTAEEYELLFDEVTTQHAIGEASPVYLVCASAADRIAATLPHAKLIFSLRNPADRAYSHYLDRVRGLRERGSLKKAMQPGTLYFDDGLYYALLLRYMERFPASQIKVILFDDLAATPLPVVQDLYAFLGIDASFQPALTRHNISKLPRSPIVSALAGRAAKVVHHLLPRSMRYTGLFTRAQRILNTDPPPLPPDLRRQMLDHYRDDIARTGALIGRDLSHWLA